jgi:hypothetical protein
MKNKFIELYKSLIVRENSEKLLNYLEKSDFFIAPASTQYHGSYVGGLVEHSLNVHNCLFDYLLRENCKDKYKMNYTDETIAIVSLLHDVCKISCYKSSFKNVKTNEGIWEKVPTFVYDDELPYGHGEKSVYIINGFIQLTREEAFAIRYHMGFSVEGDKRNVGAAFEKYPLAFALSVADMEATYYLENGLK